MPAAHVQSRSTSIQVGATTIPVSFAAAVGNANAVCGMVTWGSASSSDFSSVTDDKGNTYTLQTVVVDAGNGQSLGTFWLNNITNAPITVTASFGGNSLQFRGLVIHEASGIDTGATPTDGSTGQVGTGLSTAADAVTSGNFVTASNGDYIFGCTARDDAVVANVFAAGTNYTLRESLGGAGIVNVASESLIQTNAATTAATFTSSTNAITALTAALALKAAAAAVAFVQVPLLARFP